MTSELRSEIESFCPARSDESDDMWQLRSAEAILSCSAVTTGGGDLEGGGLPLGSGDLLKWSKQKKRIVDSLIVINATALKISAEIAGRLVDQAVMAGHPREELRWRMGTTQRRMLRHYMRMVSDFDTLRHEVEHGGGEYSGNFVGVPYIVDPSMREDAIVLEVVREADRIGVIEQLGID